MLAPDAERRAPDAAQSASAAAVFASAGALSAAASYNSIAILGPTATGKTAVAVRVAAALGGEILSADSRQVYRGLDIGSGKDLGEYSLPLSEIPGNEAAAEVLPANGIAANAAVTAVSIPYHLIDITGLDAEYNLFNYQKDFYRAFADVTARGALPIVAGGTGMYLDAVIRGYELKEVPVNPALRERLAALSMEELGEYLRVLKPELHNNTDLTERPRLVRAIEIEEHRQAASSIVKESCTADPAGQSDTPADEGKELHPDVRPLVFGLTFDRDTLRKRITARLRDRLEGGMIDEVRNLHDGGASWERLERLGLEYRFVSEYLQKKISDKAELFRSLNIAIGQFAKRQETWFRGMERKGVTIDWIPRSLATVQERAEYVAERFTGALAPEAG